MKSPDEGSDEPLAEAPPARGKLLRDRPAWKKRRNKAPSESPLEYRYPEFMCIGAQKAGTSWLDRNLRFHPKLWLPPIKELQYFNELYDERARVWTTRARRDKGMSFFARYLRNNKREEWDYRHIARLADIVAGPISDDWYGRIFALAPADRMCGEVTPDYGTLSDEGIAHVLRLSPQVRIIFSMRDPIERCWSHIRMTMKAHDSNDVALMEKYCGQAGVLERADYPTIMENWRRFVPADRFLEIFLDDIEVRPHAVLKDVCGFLNVAYEDEFFAVAEKPVHVGHELEMPPSVLALLKERLRPVYEGMAQLYPEIGAAWMKRHY